MVTGFVDGTRSSYLTWRQIKEMAEAGMSIQSHSRRHYDMRERAANWLAEEILGPMKTIEANSGVQPRFFCYPFGRYDGHIIEALRSAGIVAAFTTNYRLGAYTNSMLELPRVRIRGSMSLALFTRLVTGERGDLG